MAYPGARLLANLPKHCDAIESNISQALRGAAKRAKNDPKTLCLVFKDTDLGLRGGLGRSIVAERTRR